MELFELRKMLADAAELGAKQALIKAGVTAPTLSAKQAYDMYGRKTVDRWVREGLIKRIKHGERNSSVTFDAMDLETISKSSNRLSYFLNTGSINTSQQI